MAVRRQPRLLHLPKRLHCEFPPSRLHHKSVFGNNNTEVYSWDCRNRAASTNEHTERPAVGRLLLNLLRQARGEAATCPASRFTHLCRNYSVPDSTMGMDLLGFPVRTNYQHEFAGLRFSWYLAARVDEGSVAEHVGDNAVCLHLRHDALPALPRPGLAALGTSNAGGGGGCKIRLTGL